MYNSIDSMLNSDNQDKKLQINYHEKKKITCDKENFILYNFHYILVNEKIFLYWDSFDAFRVYIHLDEKRIDILVEIN